jgi:pimeloyl-ACP methyl ester carboxylesterase
MARAKTNGIELEYETFGDPAKPTMVLVMGFAMQMIGYDERFCAELAKKGFQVVRFDNRDIGLSTKLDALGLPDIMRAMQGDASASPYAVEDMADDLAGLLFAIGVEKAHLVGVSMGGFIVQETAIRHPGRVLSVASIMSSTGNRKVGQGRPEVIGVLMSPPPHTREAAIDRSVEVWRAIGSPAFPFDEARVRENGARAWDRDHEYAGVARQIAAILTMRDRTADLGGVDAPMVVIHGAEDPLIAVSGGEATARAVPGARLVVIPGMAHDLPQAAWPTIIAALVENASRAR